MSSAAEAREKERSRVKSGVMNGLARLILYRDKPQDDEADPDADPSHWSQVAFKTLEYVPPGIEAGIRLTKVLRRSRVMLKEKGRSPIKAFVFARVEEGITTKDLEDVFTSQIGSSFAESLTGKANNSNNRSKAYCELVKKYPEGLFKGFSYPDLSKKEDYRLQVLSGKRGEAASISVVESENQNSDEEELDLGSDVGSDEDPVQEGAESESLIPSSLAVSSGKRHGKPETTPRKKVSKFGDGKTHSKVLTSTAVLSGIEDGGSLFPEESSQIPRATEDAPSPSPAASLTPRSDKSNGHPRPPLRLKTPERPIPAAAMKAVANVYGIDPCTSGTSGKDKETAQKKGPTTAELMKDPFIGVKPGLPFSKGKVGAKRSLAYASTSKSVRGKKVPKRKKAATNEDDEDMLVRLEDVGDSSDEFVQEEDSDATPPKKKKGTALTMNDMGGAKKPKHRCCDDCHCAELNRGTLRRKLSTSEEAHMRENLRYMDFRQILKAFTDVRHQLNRMEAKQDRMENKNEAVNELAEKVVVAKETPAVLKDERADIGAPWGTVEDIEDALEDPEKEAIAQRLLGTVSQDQTHFPREAVRLLLRNNLRHRVYMQHPNKDGGPIIRWGKEYVVYPQCFNDLMINYMSEKVTGLKGIPKAESKWSGHFNDTRKREKREQEAIFKKKENRNNELFALCYKDTKAKLYCITEAAPLKPPRDEKKLPEYEAEKAAYIARWKPIVEAAYEKSRKKGRAELDSDSD